MRENGGDDVDLESGTPTRRENPPANPLATKMRENGGGDDVDVESGTPSRRARPNPLATLVQGHATPSKVVRATRRLASTTVKTTAGALNKGVDLVGDAVVEGAVGATATLGGKELIWKYLDLIFEDLDKKTVSVSDAGVTIAGPSRVEHRAELKASTRLQCERN